MRPYGDSNFFTRFFLKLPDTPAAFDLLERNAARIQAPLPVIWLHRMEIINAFQLHVFVGRTSGQIRVTPEQAAMAHAAFKDELNSSNRFREVPIVADELDSLFEELSLRHTAKHGYRTYDLLHVAAALILECDTFWTFDPKASRLAAMEGLKLR